MKQHAPATLRNRDSISEVLKDWLPETGRVLEIAAGTGEHGVFFATQFPHLEWLPTDGNPDSLPSIEAWRAEAGRPNLLPASCIDVLARPWSVERIGAIFCANMIHISPWKCTEALFTESASLLSPEGKLILYGPYLVEGQKTAPSNVAFDQSLRQRDPSWGIRWLHVVDELAQSVGMTRMEQRTMPANNLMLLYSAGPV